ncbi:MAG: C-GCAxxG-C-C family protein [Clostridiales bacterium]|jgi:C_GCAxxG_C_C family probable redox protein|nr:C-GCAxxG-C-C family protein [Clostridiales bacterium]
MDGEKQSKVNEAVGCFNSGFYCSQALLSTYCEELGLDKETALKLSCGLAAGMARLSSTCGAVTGAYLVISLKHGNNMPDDAEAREKTFALIQEFDKRFTAKHGSTNCRDLLGVDLRYGERALIDERVEALCSDLVRDAAEFLESILWQE